MPRLRTPFLAGIASTLVVGASPALASNRFVAPDGSGTACTTAAPCNVQPGVEDAAAGDNVYVTGDRGVYDLPEGVTVPADVHLYGVNGRPRLIVSGEDSVMFVRPGGSAEHVYVEAPPGFAAFGFNGGGGSANDVIAVAHDEDACFFRGGVLTNSVCWATGAGGIAVDGLANLTNDSVELRNVTAVAPDGIAVLAEARTFNAESHTENMYLSNVIATGANADLQAKTDGTGSASIFTNHTNATGRATAGSGASFTGSPSDQAQPPLFVDPAHGNFHEAPGSPTIDHGLFASDNGTHDFDGDFRKIGASTDIGVDERALPPAFTTGQASALRNTAATLAGSVATGGSPTTYRFEFGTTTAYGGLTQAALAPPAPTASGAAGVTAAAGGLRPQTLYHYRLVGSNSLGGVFAGADLTFTTTPFVGVALGSKKSDVKKRKAQIALSCPADAAAPCAGKIVLSVPAKQLRSAAKKKKKKAKRATIGNASFSIAAGQTATVVVKVSKKGVKRLGAGPLTALASAQAHDAFGDKKTTTGNVKLKLAKKKKKG